MTKRDILSIAFKILGVIALIYTVVFIPNIGIAISLLFVPHESVYTLYATRWHFVSTLLWTILTFFCGFTLLKWGDAITKKLIREDTKIDVTPTEDWEKQVFLLSLKIIGVIWLIRGIPDLIKAIGEVVMRWYIYYAMTSHIIGVVIGSCLSVLIGIYLLLDGRHHVRLAFREQVATLETEGER